MDRKNPSAAYAGERFSGLDGLRGVAALVVVLFHLRDHLRQAGLRDGAFAFVTGGYLMVDLFFVLSGFVLARRLLGVRSPHDSWKFVVWRLQRFAPVHGAALLLCLGYTTLILCREQLTGVVGETRAFTGATGLWSWISSALLLQGVVGPDQAGYAPAWSLSIELWVNVLAALCCAVLGFRGTSTVLLACGVLLSFVSPDAASGSVGLAALARGSTGIGLGMLAFLLYQRGVSRLVAHGLVWAGLVGTGVSMLLASTLRSPTLYAPVAAALVVGLARAPMSMSSLVLQSPPLQWLGQRSFCLYTLSAPSGLLLGGGLLLLGWSPTGARDHSIVTLAMVAASLVAADLGHRTVERPVARWLRKRRGHQEPPVETPSSLSLGNV